MRTLFYILSFLLLCLSTVPTEFVSFAHEPGLAAKVHDQNKRVVSAFWGAEQRGVSSKHALHLSTRAAFLVNMTTGQVYYELNADKGMAPASLTKLVTLYLIYEALDHGALSWGTPIPISAQAIQTGGANMSLVQGEKVALAKLVKGMSVISANNACVAMSEYLTQGNPARFIRQMNDKAKTLGMTKTVFKNVHGLPAVGQISTARDLAQLAMSYIQRFPQALALHSLATHTYQGTTHSNPNTLLRSYPGLDGLKTGFVSASGYSIVATAKRGDLRLLAVVLGAATAQVRHEETIKLLDYGFQQARDEEFDSQDLEAQKRQDR